MITQKVNFLNLHYIILGDVTSALNLSVLGGYSYQDFTNEGFYAQGGDFLIDDFSYNNLSGALDFKNGKGTITSYKNSNKLIAFFGRGKREHQQYVVCNCQCQI